MRPINVRLFRWFDFPFHAILEQAGFVSKERKGQQVMKIGKHIKEHRADAGISQDDLAQRVYVSRQTISSWENGKTSPNV